MSVLNEKLGFCSSVPTINFEIFTHQGYDRDMYYSENLLNIKKIKIRDGIILILHYNIFDKNIENIFNTYSKPINIGVCHKVVDKTGKFMSDYWEQYDNLTPYRLEYFMCSELSPEERIYVFTDLNNYSLVDKEIENYLNKMNAIKLVSSMNNLSNKLSRIDYRDINRIVSSIDNLKIDDFIVKEIGETVAKQVLENINKL